MRKIHQNSRERDVIFNNQQRCIAVLDQIAVIVQHQFFGQILGIERRSQNHIHIIAGNRGCLFQHQGGDAQRLALRQLHRSDVGLWQIEREGAADAGSAL